MTVSYLKPTYGEAIQGLLYVAQNFNGVRVPGTWTRACQQRIGSLLKGDQVEAMEIVHQRRLICMPLIQSQNLSPYRVKTNGETFAVGRINSPSMVGSMYTTQKTETR